MFDAYYGVYSEQYAKKVILHYHNGTSLVSSDDIVRRAPSLAISETFLSGSDNGWAEFWFDHDPTIKAVSFEYTKIV